MANLLDKHRIVTIDDSCGCTLTRASITGLTPDTFAAMGRTEYSRQRAIAEAVEARTVGAVARPLEVLLKSRIREIDKSQIATRPVPGRQSIILPYTYRLRKTNVSSDYFTVVDNSGAPNPGAGTNGIPASAWDITVTNPDSPRASTLTGVNRYFLPDQYLFIKHYDSSAPAGSRQSYLTAHRIVASEAVVGQPTQARVTIAASITDAGWAVLTPGERAVWQPQFGVVEIGTNNIDDRESWCHNEVATNPNSTIIDWHQTSRYTVCYTKEYETVLNAIMDGDVNDFTRKFESLPLVEQNRQRFVQYNKKWMQSVFNGYYINEHQTANTYDQLPPVLDPENGCQYGYKANALGLRTLLRNEGQVIDAMGGALDLDLIFQLGYEVKRNRQVDGGVVDTIDIMTDKNTADLIARLMIRYLQDTYGYGIEKNIEKGALMDEHRTISFTYNIYDVPDQQFRLAVFVDDFFTDQITMFSQEHRGRAGQVWVIDWSDFNIGIVDTRSTKTEFKGDVYQNAFRDFSCVIDPNTEYYDLRSWTWNTQLGDAKRHFLIENFDPRLCPKLTKSVCVPQEPSES